MERNPAARKQALKVELWQAGEKSRFSKGQAFPLEERQRKFGLQFGFSQPGRPDRRSSSGSVTFIGAPDLILFFRAADSE